MKKFLLVALVIAAFASCSEEEKKVEHNNLYFANDLENAIGWGTNKITTKGDAHSGKYYSKTDSIQPYSFAFSALLGDISEKKLSKVNVDIWTFVKNEKYKACIAVAVSRNDSTILWESSDLKAFYKEPGVWFKSSGTVKFPNNLEKTDKITVLVWNVDGKSEVRADDFEIQFFE